MKTISFVAAASNSGKTTLIEKVVRVLKARGYSVAVIKHASRGFDLDRPGKDSWRFRQAGADHVVLVGPGQMAVLSTIDQEPGIEELERAVDADIIISEGFKQTAGNRIEVFRSGVSGNHPLCLDDPSFLALVSDRPFDTPLPRFDLDDADGVAEFILGRIASDGEERGPCKF
ncbi:MAG TPA: molybdopterin-guanine dinucleotide biosynthesis protein B [Nitrospirota bacterium]|nr:molybdopterin-guanine dinucleotide biosynthesis protein B [Nitrospirota bacterium]